MDFGKGNGFLSDGQEIASSSRKRKKSYHRHTPYQIQELEAFFKECPHPDEKQRRRLSMELGLDPKQIKFWFQNKRTQMKAQHERADNNALRNENEKILCENLAIREALKNLICPSCGGPPAQAEDKQTIMQKLHLTNSQLREEYDRLCATLAKQLDRPLSQVDELSNNPYYGGSTLLDVPSSLGCPGNQGSKTSLIDVDDNPIVVPSNPPLMNQETKGMLETAKDSMVKIAVEALKELVKLLQMDEPLWTKSVCGRYTLNRENYETMFSRASHFKNPDARIESSKDSVDVNISAVDLVGMILDPDQWVHIFCTIVRKARTILSFDSEILGQQSGHLQLMYEEMHILSPLVAPREFYFLRYCQQIEAGVWIVADVSYDYRNENILPSRSWRFPSGCMIQETLNGFSKVTWVEHVEVDDKTHIHRLYRKALGTGFAYGAERWTSALQRMGERLSSSIFQDSSPLDYSGAINLYEAKRNIMKLSHRMVKSFCSSLIMPGKMDFPHSSDLDTSGVRVSLSKSTEPGQPTGIIIGAAVSLWFPVPPNIVYRFLIDESTRYQWDVLSGGNPVQQVANINTASQPGNFISVIKPTAPNETNMLILQESCMDNTSALIVYAPIDIPTINITVTGEDTSSIPLLPSGFTVTGDGGPDDQPVGSLLTVAIQILANSSLTSEQVNTKSIASVNTLISAISRKIKEALNCGSTDD